MLKSPESCDVYWVKGESKTCPPSFPALCPVLGRGNLHNQTPCERLLYLNFGQRKLNIKISIISHSEPKSIAQGQKIGSGIIFSHHIVSVLEAAENCVPLSATGADFPSIHRFFLPVVSSFLSQPQPYLLGDLPLCSSAPSLFVPDPAPTQPCHDPLRF